MRPPRPSLLAARACSPSSDSSESRGITRPAYLMARPSTLSTLASVELSTMVSTAEVGMA